MKITRNINNPLITPKDVKPSKKDFKVIGTFNAGVAKVNQKFLLLIRVAEKYHTNDPEIVGVPMYSEIDDKIIIKKFNRKDKTIDFTDPRFVKTKEQLYLTSLSHFRLATSTDGVHFEIDDKPFMIASTYYEAYGIEDPRITYIDDYYYINYSAISMSGVVTCLARTKDFKEVERLGIIFLQDNKDVAIFPEKINNKYYALNRPVSAYFNKPEMWIAASNDLISYHDHKLLASLRPNHFDNARIGASTPPFKTKIGWIEFYHGASFEDKYCVGVMVLDLNDPSKILYRSEEPLIEPSASYEQKGFMANVLFPCGQVIENDMIYLYYGNSDENICLITFSLNELLTMIKLELNQNE
ncbi:glycoside hydrolase family 130 protein [Mycoplasmatota bacterium]|nr:glycoside hydrolase family 130 protein [Mycoplasmatota bacterium]